MNATVRFYVLKQSEEGPAAVGILILNTNSKAINLFLRLNSRISPFSFFYGIEFLPKSSWAATQSSDDMAAPREISPAKTTPAMISASFFAFPVP